MMSVFFDTREQNFVSDRYYIFEMMFRLFVAIALSALLSPYSTASGNALCPLVLGCCEEDCCGEGTSWDVKKAHCISNPNSSGFNGTHSSAWIDGCVERVCCEDECCSPGETEYDGNSALCVPKGKLIVDPAPTGTLGREVTYYKATSGLFNVTLPLFSSTVARGYTSQSQLAQDLMETCKFKVNRVVEQNNYTYRPPLMLTPMAPSAEGVNDYGTNVQEEGVDEGDLLKTNGEYAFVGYGDFIVVWEVATGRYVTNITLPPIENADVHTPPKLPQSGGFDGSRKRLQALVAPPRDMPVKPTVQSLLLHDNKLAVITNGYGQSVRSKLDYIPVLTDAFTTNIRIYDISKLPVSGELTYIKETNVHGLFDSARAIDNRVHLVSFSGLDTYKFLDEPLARWQQDFQNLSEKEYLKAAKKLAGEKLCPTFVNGIIRDLSSHGEQANVAQVALWQSLLSTDQKLESTVFSQGVINAYVQVTSFDISDASEELGVTASGVLMPSADRGYTYANEKMLVIAGQGWNWVEETGGSVETTYLHGFALLDDGRTAPAAVGSFKGSLINNYAVDIVGGYMRVATTIRNSMWRFTPVVTPLQPELQPELQTENYVIVLKIPELDGTGPGILEEVGRTKSLGKDGEVFTGVRFSDDVAYVVTFERKDPFYVIKFENPGKPVVLGELNISGFSSYLHFVNAAHTLLLGAGQEADENGRVLGVQVTLYDSTDPANPSVIDRYAVEIKDDVYSSSSVEWDFKALRYVALGDDFGILIIPVRVDSYTSPEGNFDGFILLDISTTGITERFRISHVDSKNFRLGCFYWARLPERSFVVNGNVTTLKGHSIRIHDLDSGLSTGGIDLDTGADRNRGNCYYW